MLFRALALVKLVYLSRPLIHAPFELSVEPTDLFFGRPPTLDLCFQRLREFRHIHKARDLRAEDLRIDRLGEVVYRSHGVAFDDILVPFVNRGDEDDRDMLGLLPAPNHLCGLKAVDSRHLYVQ